mgnify:CR=1 FL=1
MIKKFNLLFLTMFGVGKIKYAPGTFASLITCLVFWLLTADKNYIVYKEYSFSTPIQISIPIVIIDLGTISYLYFIFILLFFYSMYAIKNVSSHFKSHDPKEIVIDEFFGQLIPLLVIYYFFTIFIENSVWQKAKYGSFKFGSEVFSFIDGSIADTYTFYIFVAFILFRFFDILKPFPINIIDNKMKNGLGVMLDDIIAGIYTSITILIFGYVYAFYYGY